MKQRAVQPGTETSGGTASVAVTATSTEGGVIEAAREFARRHGLPWLEPPAREASGLLLVYSDDRVALCDSVESKAKGFAVDFTTIDLRVGSGNLSRNQPLPKAIGREIRTVVDATAGLGQDAVLLACMGYEVTAVERSPVIAALLEDGLRRARQREEMARAIGDRLRIVLGDSIRVLESLKERPEAVYVDPMHPPKRRKSALAKRGIRLVREIVGDDSDARQLVDVARKVATRRVVVKRPDHADPLGGEPDLRFKGKLVRYDVYLRT